MSSAWLSYVGHYEHIHDYFGAMSAGLLGGRSLLKIDDDTAVRAFSRALLNARRLDQSRAIDPRYLIDALCQLGFARCRFGDPRGLDLYDEARDVARRKGAGYLAAGVLGARAEAAFVLGQYEGAHVTATIAAEEFDALGYPATAELTRRGGL